MKIALAFFTPGGQSLAEKILKVCPEYSFDLFDKKKDKASDWVRAKFFSCDALFFVGASGIAVRLIAPLIQTKDKDPAVLVLDEKGQFIIPILSGHMGGANRIARELAKLLNAQAVITTATDLNEVFAVDEWSLSQACRIEDISKIKYISSALLEGQKVGFHSDFPVRGALPEGLFNEVFPRGICVSLEAHKKPFEITLNIIPQLISLGAGCRKGTDINNFESFVLKTLKEYKISPKAIKSLGSIDLKKDEDCFISFAEKYQIDFFTYKAEELAKVEGDFYSSAFVESVTGVDNVCERAALRAKGGKLIVPRVSYDGMTMALALSDWECSF